MKSLEKTGATVGVYDASFESKCKVKFLLLWGFQDLVKSTLVRMLNRLIEPTDGSVEVDGENIMSMD